VRNNEWEALRFSQSNVWLDKLDDELLADAAQGALFLARPLASLNLPDETICAKLSFRPVAREADAGVAR